MGAATVNAGLPVAIVVLIFVWVLLGLASMGVWLWGLIDAAQRPDWAYAATGSSKTMWIVLIALLGAIPAIIYLLAIRPKVRTAQDGLTWRSPGAPPSPVVSTFCPQCGAGLPPNARFCRRCAAPQ